MNLIADEKPYRLKQIYGAWFDAKIKNYGEISTLPLELREKLKKELWLSVRPEIIKTSKKDKTKKALLVLGDGEKIETVLMASENEHADKIRYTACLSSQVGCALGCTFCATGKMGFTRNLSAREIIDQFRFWRNILLETETEINNIVLMGQGEPLLNYEEVKKALNIILEYTGVGPSKITISTAGIPSAMEKILHDAEFPPVRLAISLHSAREETREKIMPSHQKGFLEFLCAWAKRYHEKLGSRAHYLSLEYVMLAGLNDDAEHLNALISLAKKLGRVKINLISFNEPLLSPGLKGPAEMKIKDWQEKLMEAGLTATIRRSRGTDIAGACGQLQNC